MTDLGATTSATINGPIDEVWRALTTLADLPTTTITGGLAPPP
jgi:uncharacterized protein YndB with AHSA1/START domain